MFCEKFLKMKSCISISIGMLLVLKSQTSGYPSVVQLSYVPTTDNGLKDRSPSSVVYLNVTVFQRETDLINTPNDNCTFKIDIIPVDLNALATAKLNVPVQNLRQLESETAVIKVTPPPGGLLGSIESFMKVIPSFPGAVIETVGNLAVYLPELVGINVTQIFTSTVDGVRTNPVRTAVTALNNVAFCNPLLAGLNAGRCKGFFMAT